MWKCDWVVRWSSHTWARECSVSFWNWQARWSTRPAAHPTACLLAWQCIQSTPRFHPHSPQVLLIRQPLPQQLHLVWTQGLCTAWDPIAAPRWCGSRSFERGSTCRAADHRACASVRRQSHQFCISRRAANNLSCLFPPSKRVWGLKESSSVLLHACNR